MATLAEKFEDYFYENIDQSKSLKKLEAEAKCIGDFSCGFSFHFFLYKFSDGSLLSVYPDCEGDRVQSHGNRDEVIDYYWLDEYLECEGKPSYEKKKKHYDDFVRKVS